MIKIISKIRCICYSADIVKTNHSYLKPDIFDLNFKKNIKDFIINAQNAVCIFLIILFLKKT